MANSIKKLGGNRYQYNGVEFKFVKSPTGGITVQSSTGAPWVSRLVKYCDSNKIKKVSAAILFLNTIIIESNDGGEESYIGRTKELVKVGIDYITKSYKLEEDRELFSIEDRVRIIANEFISIIREGKYDVTTQGNNPYIWTIRLAPDKGTPLDRVLDEVQKKYGYKYVEFKVTFTSSYPTESPKVTYVRPRLDFTCAQYLNNLRIFSKKYWALGRGMKEIVSHLGSILNSINEVRMNNVKPDLDGYTTVETKILQVPQCLSTCGYDNLDMTKLEAFSKPQAASDSKGVGLKRDGDSAWDMTKYFEMCDERKSRITSVLESTMSVGDGIEDFHKFLVESRYLLGKVREIIDEMSPVEAVASVDFISSILSFVSDLSKSIIRDHIGVQTVTKLIDMANGIKDLLKPQVVELISKIKGIVEEKVTKAKCGYEEDEYTDRMREHIRAMARVSLCGRFGKNDEPCTIPPTKEARARIALEVKDFQKSAQVNHKGACFLVQNETCMCHYILIISGFEGTPYEGGLIMLGVRLPPNYPQSRPQFTLLNILGKDSINKNIHTGYICVSVATETGNSSETWLPGHSTLLQVAVSIQGLMLTEYPDLNGVKISEEKSKRDEQYRKARAYNKSIIPKVMDICMLSLLKGADCYGVKHIVEDHFKAIGKRLETLRKGVKGSIYDSLMKAIKKLDEKSCLSDSTVVPISEIPRDNGNSRNTNYETDDDLE